MVANGLLQPERQFGVACPARAEFRVVYAHAEGLGLDGWNTLVDRQRHRFQKALFPTAIEQQASQIVQESGDEYEMRRWMVDFRRDPSGHGRATERVLPKLSESDQRRR